jgi:hypothetical protein
MKDPERRPSKKFKMKENKKYPYKKGRKILSENRHKHKHLNSVCNSNEHDNKQRTKNFQDQMP